MFYGEIPTKELENLKKINKMYNLSFIISNWFFLMTKISIDIYILLLYLLYIFQF